MCGIAGVVHLDGQKQVDSGLLERMGETLVHRGPDAGAIWSSGSVGFSHRRLAILDLVGGDQPKRDPAGNILSFNGEIYNYIEVRETLKELGHDFETQSDTEVLLTAYRQWGMDCLDHLNGMWAFSIWDKANDRVFIARDRLGEKPLYYANFNNSFWFASEIKALLAAGVPDDPDYSMLEVYLSSGYISAPHTFYKQIRALPAGYRMVVEGGRVTESKYWDLPEIDEEAMRTDQDKVDEEFEHLLTDSVRIRMRSDVPYGAFLSGGLDSSSIVALMSEISSHPVETFTVGFTEKDFDERQLARAVSEKFKTKHSEAVLELKDFEESLALVLHHYDDPFGDSSAVPTGQVSKYAAESVKMVLTGDGGDEVLSGYTIYQGEKFANTYQKLPQMIQSSIPQVLGIAEGMLPGGMRRKAVRAVKVTEASAQDFEDRLIAKISWGNQGLVRELLASTGESLVSMQDYIRNLMSACPYKDPFYRLMYFNLKESLPNDMLVKVDRMSMAHSLETRVPFLDHRLVELMVHVHKNVKMDGYQRKSVLRRTIAQRLPQELLHAPKRGFSVPMAKWFGDPEFNGDLNTLKSASLGFSGSKLDDIFQSTQSGGRDYGHLLWILFVFQRWMRRS